MKKILSLFFICITLLSCSSDNSNLDSNFTINIVISAQSIEVDQEFTITVNGNESIQSIEVSFDNFINSSGASQDFGLTKTLTFNFDKVGTKTIFIRAKNSNNVYDTKVVTVNVVRGTALKIKKLQLLSFNNINGTWDPEFAANDPNRLADLKFNLSRVLIYNYFLGTYNMSPWYTSQINENQQSLIWDLEPQNLYLKPNASVQFSLSDMDGDVLGNDLMMGPPYYKTFNFSNYLVTKPEEIIYTFPEINLEFKLFVEWVN